MNDFEADLNHPGRYDQLSKTVKKKDFLKQIYDEVYDKYKACLEKSVPNGIALELGSGGGFVKDKLKGIVTSDIIPYKGVDQVVDGTAMPFPDQSLRAIFMYNVFHHIPDAELFLKEAQRCLKVGGRALLVEPHPGLISYPIYRWAHHEPFEPKVKEWRFASKGPLSDANGALPWIVFQRDRKLFEQKFPNLKLERYEPHSPLRYWLSGGLKKWTLVPGWSFGILSTFDRILVKTFPCLGSFTDIEIVKISNN